MLREEFIKICKKLGGKLIGNTCRLDKYYIVHDKDFLKVYVGKTKIKIKPEVVGYDKDSVHVYTNTGVCLTLRRGKVSVNKGYFEAEIE